MLKSIILISVFSLFISSTAYIPTAEANWAEDAIKNKIRRELRKSAAKARHRNRHHNKDNHQDRRGNHKYNAVNFAITKIKNAQYQCADNFGSQSWRQESICFRRRIRNIKLSVNNDLRYKRLRPRAYETLTFIKKRLSKALRACQNKNTWKREAFCFERRLEKIINNY